jgi:hypothetical protein
MCYLPAQPCSGLRAFEDAGPNGSPSVALGSRERSGGLGRHLAGRLAAAGEESVVDVQSKLFQHECGCSQPVTLARTMSSKRPRHCEGRLA